MKEYFSEEQYNESNHAQVEYSVFENGIKNLQEKLHTVEQILKQLQTVLEKEKLDLSALEKFNAEAREENDRELPFELAEYTHVCIEELKDAISQKEYIKKYLEESIKRERLLEDGLTEVLKRHSDSAMH